jgi:hypothetical protein
MRFRLGGGRVRRYDFLVTSPESDRPKMNPNSPFVLSHKQTYEARTRDGSVREVTVEKGKKQQRWRFEPQKAIFYEGELASSAYYILSGEIAIVKTADGAGKYAPIARLSTGDVFGELALIDGGYRSAAAVAITPAEVLVLERGDFETELSAIDPAIREAFEIMIGFVRAVPPRTMWADGRIPAAAVPHIEAMRPRFETLPPVENLPPSAFLRAIYAKLVVYVRARLPA